MIRLMADNNAEGQVEILLRVLSGELWPSLWNEMETTVVTFEDLHLPREASDADLWRRCQGEQVILITNNRNADDPDSLESIIRAENRPDYLPVFTLAKPRRIEVDRDYAEAAALRLLEYLSRLDGIRGTGRLFLP